MKISIIIVSFNQEQYIASAIESALSQTLAPFEIIIADDRSTDGSRGIIESYAEKNPDLIRVFLNETNLGIAGNRNRGLENVQGDWVTFLDSDDIFDAEKLERETEIALAGEERKVDFVYSNHRLIDPSGEPMRRWTDRAAMPEGTILEEIYAMAFPNWALFRSELVRYDLWKSVGFYDPKLRIYEDYDMRIRLAEKATVAYCDHVGSWYRRHDAGLSRAPVSEHIDALEYIMKKNRPLLDRLPAESSLAVRRECGRILRYYYRRALLHEKKLPSPGKLWRTLVGSPIA